MRKTIAIINMSVDGFFDHTLLTPDEEIHRHYTELLDSADGILYGRITYQLMEYWRPFKESPSDEQSMNDFARSIDRIPKIVFSHTLKNIDWDTAKLSGKTVEETVSELKKEPGRDIFIGSRSLIVHLANLNLIDQYQLCVHPVVAGKGRRLFEGITGRILFGLDKTKTFRSGAVILYYSRS